MSVYFVIFGAAVRPDGTPGATLVRRVEGALSLARGETDRMFVATGGAGRHGPPEAHVIRDLLVAKGIGHSAILVEDMASDTLESVLFCDRMLQRRDDVHTVVVCSSSYHTLRCGLLFRLLGYKVRVGKAEAELTHLGWPRWVAYVLKECVALPYDSALLLLRSRLWLRATRG